MSSMMTGFVLGLLFGGGGVAALWYRFQLAPKLQQQKNPSKKKESKNPNSFSFYYEK